MNQVKKVLLAIGLFLSSGIAMAHPGHGTFTGTEIKHYLTSPMHIGVVMAIIVVSLLILRVKISNKG